MPIVPSTVRSLRTQRCQIGCPVLDALFRGGIPSKSITELTGEAGAAKTQICLQLLVSVQGRLVEGGLEGSAIYIYTEGEPPLVRLQELATARSCSSPRPLDNVFMEMDIHTGDDLLRSLTMAERILQQPPGLPVRLIIIDSIASIFRDAGDNAGVTEYTERAGMLFRIAGLLKRYAYQYDLAVVVTNQVTDVVEDLNSAACAHTGACKLMSGGRQVVPALGLSWANCVNTRIFLSKLEEHEMARLIVSGNGSGKVPSIRSMQVVFSPFLPPSNCLYVVQREGVLGVKREEE